MKKGSKKVSKELVQKQPEKKNGKTSKTPFYIVAMGGSAGGLEAFEHFFLSCLLTAGWPL